MIDLAAARAVCEKAPNGIHMVTITRHGETWSEPTRKSIEAYDAMRELVPAALSEIETLRAALEELLEAAAAYDEIADRDDNDPELTAAGDRLLAAQLGAANALPTTTEVSR